MAKRFQGVLVAGALGLLIILMGWLCLSMTVLPLADLPNHLARLFILQHIATDAHLAEYYRVFWHFQPNLSLEAVAFALAPFLDIYAIGRLVGVETFAALAIGLAALHRVLHGGFSSAALLPIPLIVNRYYVWGSLGYLLALGVAFGAVAVWIGCSRRPVLQVVLGTVLATAVYFGHLYAFGVYAVCTVSYEAWSLLPRLSLRPLLRRGGAVVVQLLPAILSLVFLSPTTQTHEVPQWLGLQDKLAGPIVLLPGYDLKLEAVLLTASLAVPALAWLRGAARFRLDLALAIAAFAILYVILPDRLFSGYGADRRLLVPLAVLVLVSFEWSAASFTARVAQWSFVALLSLISVANVATHWLSYNRLYADLRHLTTLVDPGARVFGVMINASSQYLAYPPPQEVVSLAVIERSAFVPSLFVYPTNAASSPLVYTTRYVPLAERKNLIFASRPAAAQAMFDATRETMERHGFGYLLLIDSPRFAVAVPGTYQLLGTTGDGTGKLFRSSQ